jgi:hypothetical protein
MDRAGQTPAIERELDHLARARRARALSTTSTTPALSSTFVRRQGFIATFPMQSQVRALIDRLLGELR